MISTTSNSWGSRFPIIVSILYLLRLWFLPKLGNLDDRAVVESQSSIYRGYDFYPLIFTDIGRKDRCLNPLSTEVMISTRKNYGRAASGLRSQSSIYRGYDFYKGKTNEEFNLKTWVSILYLPRLWFLLTPRDIESEKDTKSQSSIYRGYDFYWFLFLHPPSCGSRVNCANQTWVR